MSIRILVGDAVEQMRTLADASVASVATDPPYELGFMGREWDRSGVAFRIETWAEVLRVMKPGAYLAAFGGTRTFHRLTCAIEDAGFEIRDCLVWLHGQGFPKSHDVSKAIDREAGADREVIGERRSVQAFAQSDGRVDSSRIYNGRAPDYGGVQKITAPATDAAKEWAGWGTALKPAWEPIILARKPLMGTVAANVQRYGTGALNIDGCRIESEPLKDTKGGFSDSAVYGTGADGFVYSLPTGGRWPANVILDEDAGAMLDAQSGETGIAGNVNPTASSNGWVANPARRVLQVKHIDIGGASRFFYCAKASTAERGEGNTHPTVKPRALMRWLVRLITPKGGIVLDPFLGSGSTALACESEGFEWVGIERDPEYAEIARRRITNDAPMFAEISA